MCAWQHRDWLVNSLLTCSVLSLILLKISSNNFQKPLGESGLDNLKRSRLALKALILVEFRTRNGSWFQCLIILFIAKEVMC